MVSKTLGGPVRLAALCDRRIQALEEKIVNSLRGNWKEDVLFELQQTAQCDKQSLTPRQKKFLERGLRQLFQEWRQE